MKAALLTFGLIGSIGSAVLATGGTYVTPTDARSQHVCVHDASTGKWYCTKVITEGDGDTVW